MAYESIRGLLAQSRCDGHFHRSSRGSRGGARCANHRFMCNLYSITTNQAAIIALFRVINRYVRNLPPMPGVFPDFPAPVVRNADGDAEEMVLMRWGMPPPRTGVLPVTNIRNTSSPHWRGWFKPENRCRHLTFCASEPFAGAASSDWPLR